MTTRVSIVFVLCLFASLDTARCADVASLLRQGDALDRQLKTREALDVYLQADKAEPGNADILRRISREHGLSMCDVTTEAEKRERGEKALEDAKRAVAADAGNAQAQLALAICYGRLAPLLDNKTKIAYSKLVKEHVDLSLKLDASNDLAYHVLGAWNYELANLNPFLRVIASALYGSLPDASNKAAAGYFEKAIALNSRRMANHVELGRTYAAMGNKIAARVELEKGLAMPIREKDDEENRERARAALRDL